MLEQSTGQAQPDNVAYISGAVGALCAAFFNFMTWLIKFLAKDKNQAPAAGPVLDEHQARMLTEIHDMTLEFRMPMQSIKMFGDILLKLTVIEENRDKQLEKLTDVLNALQLNMQLQSNMLNEQKQVMRETNHHVRDVRHQMMHTRAIKDD